MLRGSMITTLAPTSNEADPSGLVQFRRRRSTAFALGEAKARQREISADAYLFLYKELVGLAGDRTYCWPSLDFLAATLDTSEGTLKRWMKELERTDLIRRKPRPGGQTSLTYITAYLAPDVAAAVEDESPPEAAAGQSGASPVAPADRRAHAEPPRPAPPQRDQAA